MENSEPTMRPAMQETRVLMLNYEFPPLGGGSGNATYYLLRELESTRGLQIDLVTSSASNHFERLEFADSIRIFRLPVGKTHAHFWTASEIGRWLYRTLRFVEELTAETRYDLCHCWSGWPSGLIGYWCRKKFPYVVALRGSDVPGYSQRLAYADPILFRPLSRMVWKAADAVTIVSSDLARLAARTAPDVSLEVIGNGVSASQFAAGPKPAQFTILYAGRLIPRKGIFHLLQAFAELVAEGEECRLVIAGSGPEQGEVERFCRERKIDARVEILGEVQHEDLPNVYARASVFVMPALEEAMSNAVLEAMASSLPIIATKSGVTDFFDDNGVIVEKRDHRQIKAAIRGYLNDPDRVDRHGKRSRAIAEELTWTKAAQAYTDLYRRVAARRVQARDRPLEGARR